ncbi:MAG: nucleotidyltransferase domain-containing protein [Anaerosomatales bacterium]|nr:nucleotidyltransferase domain-containing protein [Coriobacteriia bacterium]
MTNRVGRSAVSSLFASDTLVALLGHFALHPEGRFYQRELARLTGSSLYLVQRELARLVHTGILCREPRGRQVEYSLVPAHPAWPGLSDLLLRTEALAGRLASALEPLDDRVALAWIFGSTARGDARPDSDIDLMVISSASLRELAESDLPGMAELGRELNIVTYTPDELRARATADNHFVAEVLDSPRLWVKGGEDELAALRAGRAAPSSPGVP